MSNDLADEVEEMSTRMLFELADGMRHWWNDDNPEQEQLEHYSAVAGLGELVDFVSTQDEEAHARIQTFEQYIVDLEAIVGELYRRYETSRIAEAVTPEPCAYCGEDAESHWCADITQTYE